MKYAWDVTKAVLVARAQQLGLFYDRRFDCVPADRGNAHYQPKLDFVSPHSVAVEHDPGWRAGARSRLRRRLRRRDASAAARLPRDRRRQVSARPRTSSWTPSSGTISTTACRRSTSADYDYVLLLDVIEHLASPEAFVERLRDGADAFAVRPTLLVSTANIGFFVNRLMLLIGQFNYGKRGILDLTHTRLFTFASFRRLFEQGGFRVREIRGIPGPFALVFGTRSARPRSSWPSTRG